MIAELLVTGGAGTIAAVEMAVILAMIAIDESREDDEARLTAPLAERRTEITAVADRPINPEWGENTAEFHIITSTNWRSIAAQGLYEWCTWCQGGQHSDCPGCTCPCGEPAPVMAGVDIHHIGQRELVTR